jgi:hypothetical protein
MSIRISQWLTMEQSDDELRAELDETLRILAGIRRRNRDAVRRNAERKSR